MGVEPTIKRSDLFADDPLPKAFYHPSRQRQVDHLKNEACLGSGRVSQELDREDTEFLQGGYTYTHNMPGTTNKKHKYPPPMGEENSGRFDESWAASERPSTVSIPDLCDTLDFTLPHSQQPQPPNRGHSAATYTFQVPERDTDSGKKSQGAKTVDSSTLSKYIDRFRYGQPTSREERDQHDAVKREDDFWWLSKTSASDTSMPLAEGDGKTRRFTPRTDKDTKREYMSLKDYSASGKDFKLQHDVRLLHDRADRLLEKTGSSSLNSSEPVVSTEGLGSAFSTSSDTPRTVEEQSYRPTFTEPHTFSKPLKPEDDILAQWRRNRKVELLKTSDRSPLHQTGSSDLENKLAAFRKRLATTLTEAQNEGQTTSVSKDLTKTVADVPIPARIRKEVSKQVDSECQTSPRVTPRESRTDTLPATKSSRPHTHSPIASPSLPRVKAFSPGHASSGSGNRDVEPHLHLSCDIIPCPVIHTQRYHGDARTGGDIINGNHTVEIEKGRLGKDKKIWEEEQGHLYGGLNGTSEESDSSFELMKRKHLRLLREEQVLRKQVSRSGQGRIGSHRENREDYEPSASGPKEKSEVKGRIYREQKEVSGNNREGRGKTMAESCDLVSSDESFTDVTELQPPSKLSSNHSRQEDGRRSERKGKGQGETDWKYTTTENFVEYSKGKNRSTTTKPREDSVKKEGNTKEKQVKPQAPQSQKVRSRSPKDKRGFGRVPAPQTSINDSQEGLVIDRLPKKSQSRKAGPRPLHSSPMPSLNSAIGQVVGDHLFMSSVSFASSVDSLPRQTIHEQPEATLSQDENFEAAIHSDGEDFKEDEILQDLRKRRHVYLDKLRRIDTLSSEKQS